MEFITAYWAYIVIGVMAVDKIVAITPTKYDDMIVTFIKKVWKTARPK